MNCHFCEAEIASGTSDCKKCGSKFGYLVRGEIRGLTWVIFRGMAWAALVLASFVLFDAFDGMRPKIGALLPAVLGLWMLFRYALLLAKKPKWWRRTI